MSRLEISEQARKILERERELLDQESMELSTRLTTPGSVLSAICKLLNHRGRYFAQAGEHFSVQDYDGLIMIDTLDEHMLRAINSILKKYIEHAHNRTNTQAVSLIADRMLHDVKEMPKYPVAYRMLYSVRHGFEKFDEIIENNNGFNTQDLEVAFSHHILGLTNKYIQTRDQHGVRHFSDVAREYDVVSRLKCKCGEDQFNVKLQTLKVAGDGVQYDSLDLECKACGHQRSVTFDLPHFKDLYQA